MPASVLLTPALWQSIVCEWLWVYDGIAPRAQVWSQKITVPPGVFFVQSGQVKIDVGREVIVVGKGDAFFSAPGTRRQWFDEDTRLLSVGLHCRWPDGLHLYQTGLDVAVPGKRLKLLHEATRTLFTQVHGRRKQVGYVEATTTGSRSLQDWTRHEAAYRQWFAEFVSTLKRLGITPNPRKRAEDRRLEHLRAWLQSWPLDRALDLKAVALEVELSPRRIHQLLRDDLGMTAQVYQERRRLEHARQRLTQGTAPLKEIAFGLGFRHPPHFTAWFRRHTGMTPTACRAGYGLEGA
ncbi:AraC-like DNA-binding protein [Prosthecobacter fusiformis]|uniref:AraC-like DNA-binding protein n=1 Tax=Prosthecobacter fusiformis TaxID=48464 RepID=A0A4R7S6Q3_9BACT|nr:AraC family transcriptional regulator [Prosthecobacter fusiformis]TDU73386.1 AraC-like DNA-binding protein [Prosthecobacter fusiformis]